MELLLRTLPVHVSIVKTKCPSCSVRIFLTGFDESGQSQALAVCGLRSSGTLTAKALQLPWLLSAEYGRVVFAWDDSSTMGRVGQMGNRRVSWCRSWRNGYVWSILRVGLVWRLEGRGIGVSQALV